MSLRNRLEAALAGTGLAVLRRMGPVAASNFGGWVARTIGPLLPVSRVADANLRAVMPELDLAARRRVVRGVWDNLGRTVGELPHIGQLSRTATGPGWEIEGEVIGRALAAAGGPVILVSGHIGNWEVLPRVAAALGLPIANFYRAASNPIIDAMIIALRQEAAGIAPPQPHFAKGAAGARAALAHLAGGGRVGMLVDQKMNDGIAVPFLGRPAMTAPAAAALALRFGCPVVPAHVQRLGPARLRVVCEPPLPLPASGDRRADVAALTLAINLRLEAWIRARPDSWLWLHRRWPRP
ncbi:MAG: lauroyl acyltransferase [Rhodospirillales bacterium]|nr:lauroyl acyltransferase [Rhodospirillales bacterium]